MTLAGWKAGLGTLVLAGLLAACTPPALRPQPGALLHLDAHLATPPVVAITGDTVYAPPGPGILRVSADQPAFITTLFVAPSGDVQVLPQGAVPAHQVREVALPASLGFTQVYTVASLQPMDLTAAQGRHSLNEAASVVETQARTLPPGAYTVVNTTYRVTRFGKVRVNATLPGAEVLVNGRRVGLTPVLLPDVPEGALDVEVRRRGAVPYETRVLVLPDATVDVMAFLVPAQGTLTVQSSLPASVTAAGRPLGNTPLQRTLRTGPVTLSITPLDGSAPTQTLTVTVRPEFGATVTCTGTGTAFRCLGR